MNTQKLEHTQGPWVAVATRTPDREATISVQGNGNSEFIATLDVVSVNGGPFALPPNAKANASLIAAAPEMLAALREIETLTQRVALPSDTKQGWEPVAVERMAQIAEKTRKVIAKAKGGAE